MLKDIGYFLLTFVYFFSPIAGQRHLDSLDSSLKKDSNRKEKYKLQERLTYNSKR
jgi:hypothetical protein